MGIVRVFFRSVTTFMVNIHTHHTSTTFMVNIHTHHTSPTCVHSYHTSPTCTHTHTQTITDLSMSPDGLVLASSSEDGHLKFWQIDWENRTHKCLHDYVPHNGAPVTRLIFCDNHTIRDPSYVRVVGGRGM